MTHGMHVGHAHGPAQTGGAPTGMNSPEFQSLLGSTADKLGVSRDALKGAMHEAESLYAGRAGMTEDQKLSAMVDHIKQRLNLSNLSNEEMMALGELCRICLDEWERQAALEEGVVIRRGSFGPLTAGLAPGAGRGGGGGGPSEAELLAFAMSLNQTVAEGLRPRRRDDPAVVGR